MSRLLIDLPEVIETSRLRLQAPSAGMGEKVHQAIMDEYEDYVKWLMWPSTPPTVDQIEEECRRNRAEFILRDLIRYIIFDKETQQVLGRCAFTPTQANWMIPQFGISYFIRKSQRLKGYCTESVHAMTVLAFRSLKSKKVEIYCDSNNLASIKIPLKLGFKLEYTQKGGWLRANGELAELQTYSLFSEKDLLKI